MLLGSKKLISYANIICTSSTMYVNNKYHPISDFCEAVVIAPSISQIFIFDYNRTIDKVVALWVSVAIAFFRAEHSILTLKVP